MGIKVLVNAGGQGPDQNRVDGESVAHEPVQDGVFEDEPDDNLDGQDGQRDGTGDILSDIVEIGYGHCQIEQRRNSAPSRIQGDSIVHEDLQGPEVGFGELVVF